MAERVEDARPLDQPGELRRLGQIDLAEILAEVDLRRLPEAADIERPAPAEIDLVGVVLEDLLLGEALLQLQRDDHLGELARPALALVEPEHARELHAERRRALALAAFLDIDVSGFDDADRVEAAVLEEALVLGRGDRLHQHRRNVAELDEAPLFPARPREVGDELRFELVLRARWCCPAARRST